MRKISFVALAALALLVLPGCTKERSPAPAKFVRVSATKAYEKYFGPAPTTDKGTCYAFVIYFPSAKAPGKVVPFPFFTFDQASLKKVAVERLMAGMDLPALKGEMLQPFAPGAHLTKLSEQDGVVTVDLGKDFLRGGGNEDALSDALLLTVAQFEGVKGVRLLSEGKEVAFAKGVRQPVAGAALDPAPPRLLAVTAMKDKGATAVEEVDAYFDRPVEITSLVIADKDGVPFAGETFHSVFDMAAVLKPKEPAQFKAGLPVRVRWKVVDKLGRRAEGDSVQLLEVREH